MTNFTQHLKTLNIDNDNILDKVWRVENLYPIRNKSGVLIPLKQNPHQVKVSSRMIENLSKGIYDPITILKSRQLGMTTLFAIWFLDDVLFYEGVNAAIQSHKKESMVDIFETVRTAYDYMHPDFKRTEDKSISTKKDKASKTELKIADLGSKIEVKLEVRSKSVSRMLFSEYAFTDWDRIIASMGSLGPNALRIYESTPNGINHFHDFYNEEKEKNPKNVFFFPWFEHDEYRIKVAKPLTDFTEKETQLKKDFGLDDEQIQFRRVRSAAMRKSDEEHQQFEQEYPENDDDCFLMSGIGLIDPKLLRQLKKKCEKVEPEKRFWDGKTLIKIYKIPDREKLKDKDYYGLFAGLDPAEGVGGDYSGLVLIGIDHLGVAETLMTIRGQEDATKFAKKAHKYLFKYYRYEIDDDEETVPVLTVERNNHGHEALAILVPIYPNLYIHHDKKEGFFTSHTSRRMILGNLFNLIREGNFKPNDVVIAKELITLRKNEKGKVEAEVGKKDDMVLASALSYQGHYSDFEMYGHDSEDDDEGEESEAELHTENDEKEDAMFQL